MSHQILNRMGRKGPLCAKELPRAKGAGAPSLARWAARGRARLAFAPLLSLIAIAALAFALTGCASGSGDAASAGSEGPSTEAPQSRTFTDDLGRTVELPAQIDRIAPSGHTANQVLLTMAPEKMVGVSQKLTDAQLRYLPAYVADLPEFGAAFGKKGNLNKEAVAAAGAQVLIDTGEPKDGLAEDLDALQEQLGIPCVFIDTPLDCWDAAYTRLGELLGMPERGAELSAYCASAYRETTAAVAQVPADKRVRVAYLSGKEGLNAIAKGSYQGTVIDLVAENVVAVESPSGSGQGNEIGLEQLTVWNPDLIVFGANSVYGSVGQEAGWSGISAISSGTYYEVPSEPWTWLNNPPTVNQVLGLQWFARLCYPDRFGDDLESVVTGYYRTFYGYELSHAEYEGLVEKATRR